MNTFTVIQKIIDEGMSSGLPVPRYVTCSIHADETVTVDFQFGSQHQVEQWANHGNADPKESRTDSYTAYDYDLPGDGFTVHCYCLIYDSEQVPA